MHSQVARIEKVIKIALGSIAGFSLFVSGIGIMNMCLVSVGEKTQEIGLRKSVGAKRIDIFWQFLTESICLCFCGTLLGIGGRMARSTRHGTPRCAYCANCAEVARCALWTLDTDFCSLFSFYGH